VQRAPVVPGADTETALADWGFSPDEIAALRERGAVA
jgi:alpha-methylacyl-CoA racemase